MHLSLLLPRIPIGVPARLLGGTSNPSDPGRGGAHSPFLSIPGDIRASQAGGFTDGAGSAWGTGASPHAAGPHLQRLLTLSDRLPPLSLPFPASLYAQFDPAWAVEPPAGAFTALANGLDPGDRYWLRADPIHLRAQRDDLTIMPVSDLDESETAGLLATLNIFLAADGLQLHAGTANEWLLPLRHQPDLVTTPLALAAGAPMGHHLPRGKDAGQWLGRMTEWQMLLHDHAVNAAREARACVPVNGLWLWGSGRLPGVPTSHFDLLCAGASDALGLALRAGIKGTRMPSSLGDLPQAEHPLVVFDQDIDFAALDAHWFGPSLQAVKEKRVNAVDLYIGDEITLRFRLRPRHLWRFWRRTG